MFCGGKLSPVSKIANRFSSWWFQIFQLNNDIAHIYSDKGDFDALSVFLPSKRPVALRDSARMVWARPCVFFIPIALEHLTQFMLLFTSFGRLNNFIVIMAHISGLNILGKLTDYFYVQGSWAWYILPIRAMHCDLFASFKQGSYCLTNNFHSTREQEKGSEKLLLLL